VKDTGAAAAAAPTSKGLQGLLTSADRILDDKDVDAIAIAAPDHWHAPATILACAAGKHVYVEKPCSHNAREGELALEASRKHKRVVQHGTQRRSWPKVAEAIQRLREGVIGRLIMSRGWYNNRRGSIGRGTPAPIPANLNYDLWQGPAPERPFRSNILHYNWHWFWHWGTAELGNNGIHALDICRWGLGVDYPTRVTSAGGRYHFDDDQETPDTHLCTFEFPDNKIIAWEGRSCHPHGFEGSGFGISFFGEGGSLLITDAGYRILDKNDKEIQKVTGPAGDADHFKNFLNCIRDGKRPVADIEEAHKSTILCHLGNIAYRTGRSLATDPKSGRIKADDDAMKLWSRDYRPGWEPKV
jgi:predicted dehydrogenase